ncbi:hypothetical protein ACP4OV_027724 [Aristida adscensionis]
MALRRRLPYHLAAVSLGLLLLLLALHYPHASADALDLLPGAGATATAATNTNASISTPPPRGAAAPSAAGRLLRALMFSSGHHAPPPPPSAPTLHGASSASPRRRLQRRLPTAAARSDRGTTTAPPSAAPAAAPRPRGVRARRVRPAITCLYWRDTFDDLRAVCQPPLCRADPNFLLYSVVVGPHYGRRGWEDDDSGAAHVYCALRTVRSSPPILPRRNAWRATITSSSDVCRVELGHMDSESFSVDCPDTICLSYCTESTVEPLEWAIDAIASPCGVGDVASSSAASSAAAASTTKTALLAALPLLAIAFLPPSLAAAAVVLSLAPVVRADLSEDEYLRLNHATCAVYPYDNAAGAADRARPVPCLRAVCLRPLCIDADPEERTLAAAYAAHRGRRDDPLRVYCAVHSLEGASSPSIFFPWRNVWRAHLPVADPDAAAASGDDVCYVELAHLDYREGYYIRCPAAGSRHAHSSCTEFPEEAVAWVVWEHRSLTYRDTVGSKCDMYKFGGAGAQFGEFDADL